MTDTFKGHSQNLIAPPASAVEVTPSDTADLAFATRAIYVGTAGNLKARMLDGTEVTLSNVQAGCQYAMRVDRIFSTGTTASGIVAFW
jgi:hypothetical protein